MSDGRAPPVLPTPASHILEDPTAALSISGVSHLSDEQIYVKYEIGRTVAEIRNAKYTRTALQFPDHMLPDAPRVFEALRKGLQPTAQTSEGSVNRRAADGSSATTGMENLNVSLGASSSVKLYILADTSYGACCVDEIAAEHVNADAVVHYGRACLSPTSRIPVIHIFTVQTVDQHRLCKAFQEGYVDLHSKVVLMADVTCQSHLISVQAMLEQAGYTSVFTSSIVHDPSSLLPNRTLPDEVKSEPRKLRNWHLFYVSEPPNSLLLTLSSRVASIRIFPTSPSAHGSPGEPFLASTSRALRRRYGILTSVATVSVFGILINTLSVKNYLHIVEHVKSRILAVGKKSYTFVVGKINAAKVANFGEIGAWIVVGCWESSLIDSKDFWKPVITPFELELAVKSDGERVWTGEWSSNFQAILDDPVHSHTSTSNPASNGVGHDDDDMNETSSDSESKSAPPEFDLRTGRYISHSRPMQVSVASATHHASDDHTHDSSLIRRAKGDLAVIGGEMSPGAEYLRTRKTWKGLGTDLEIAYEEASTAIEQGRSGIAKGYYHGEDDVRT